MLSSAAWPANTCQLRQGGNADERQTPAEVRGFRDGAGGLRDVVHSRSVGPRRSLHIAVLLQDDLRIAENVLLYQRDTGGWPKNYDRDQELTEAERLQVLKDKSKRDAMIDNGATHTEIRLLAGAFQQTGDTRFEEAALRGIRYLLDGQYDNGGWPQQFPEPKGYARYITFNDHAMIGVMTLLRDVEAGKEAFAFAPQELRRQCGQAVERGIECILKCQLSSIDGKPTVWCAAASRSGHIPRPRAEGGPSVPTPFTPVRSGF